MEITYSTPALLFPTVSLLYIGYTNRFFAIANLIRALKAKYEEHPGPNLIEQMVSLRRRLVLIRNMQTLGILALFFCMGCMMLIYLGYQQNAKATFAIALGLLMTSLLYSLREIQMSIDAIRLDINMIEEMAKRKEGGMLPDPLELLRRD